MKMSEVQLRQIIRKSLIKEYRGGSQNKFTWQTCEKIDLPDHLFKTEEGRNAVKSAEKVAAIAAQAYGMPGFVCDIFSSLIGDNPNRSLNRDLKSNRKKQKKLSLTTGIYKKTFDKIEDDQSLFISRTAQNINGTDDEKKTAIAADTNEHERLINQINAATSETETEPLDALENVNNILAIPPGDSKSVVKAMVRRSEIDNNKIIRMIRIQSITLLKTMTLKNLSNDAIRRIYSNVDGYDEFVSLNTVNI